MKITLVSVGLEGGGAMKVRTLSPPCVPTPVVPRVHKFLDLHRRCSRSLMIRGTREEHRRGDR
jgi:hypothetical protein